MIVSILTHINDVRRAQGLMTIEEIQRIADLGNVIFDPFSLLISARVKIGRGNIFFPCVYLFCSHDGELAIGDDNKFHTNTFFEASFGPIIVGSSNQFGEGGFTAKTNRPRSKVVIEDDGRYLNGASVYGASFLGSGSQILGQVTAESCHLHAGASYRDGDPDLRAGLLKGVGTARNLMVPKGHVIVGTGAFDASNVERQSVYHPKL